MHTWGRTALLALSASLVIAAPASAAPPEPFEATCGGTTYTLTSGNGMWAVAKDTESNTRFIPVAFTFEARDSDGEVLFSDSERKNGHRNQEKITCTFEGTFVDEEGFFGEPGALISFSGTATVVQKP